MSVGAQGGSIQEEEVVNEYILEIPEQTHIDLSPNRGPQETKPQPHSMCFRCINASDLSFKKERNSQ